MNPFSIIYTAIAAIAIIVIEAAILFFVIHWIFRYFKWQTKTRNITFFLLSYPGMFMAVSGWIGIIFPVPALLGLPIEILLLSSDANSASWLPLPLIALFTGTSSGGVLNSVFVIAAEILVLAFWLLVSLKLVKRFNSTTISRKPTG